MTAPEGAGQRPRCAVLGSPIAHSLSPVLHRAAYADLGVDWEYTAIEMDEEGLAGFLASLDSRWRGLSLTMPLKRAVMELLDEADPWARAAGAANTVTLSEGRRVGANTDVPGAIAALREHADGPWDSALVLGGGATATSILLALDSLGCRSATLAVRSPERAGPTIAALAAAAPRLTVSVEPLQGQSRGADVLVSTIPAAAQTPALAALEAPVTFEVLYDPWPTPLARAAADRGAVLVSGLDLLAHQAAGQVTLMTGLPAPLEAMRAAGRRALAGRAR